MNLVETQFDTISSLATSVGTGALAIIRVSGKLSFNIFQKISHRNTVTVRETIVTNIFSDNKLLDEAIITLFKSPYSFTKEDMMEISIHNSTYIIQTLLLELIKLGTRQALPGEFTQRAYLNGRFDLAQAEAIADIIASDSKASHQVALNQMRGGISSEIKQLRTQLIDFAALLELELDFGEEDVQFANRDDLTQLIHSIQKTIQPLLQSFTLGNSLKKGIPIVIVGKPNTGKSTLLNTLLNEERAIVSEIPGTTRDTIEDEIAIDGIKFRFIDTAGLRDTDDTIEAMGIKKTQEKMQQASLILMLFDSYQVSPTELTNQVNEIKKLSTPLLIIGNKLDKTTMKEMDAYNQIAEITWISAAKKINIEQLKLQIQNATQTGKLNENSIIVTNARHYQHLSKTNEALQQAINSLEKNISTDWITLDIREALNNLGAITGEITNDDILSSIFSKFCIGK